MSATTLYFSIVCTQRIKNNKSGDPDCINHPQGGPVARRGRLPHFKKAAEQVTDINAGKKTKQNTRGVCHYPLQNIKEKRNAAEINAHALPQRTALNTVRQCEYKQCRAERHQQE